MEWLKVRQIASELYGGDLAKVQAVAPRREAQGKFKVDADFPDDKEERRYPRLLLWQQRRGTGRLGPVLPAPLIPLAWPLLLQDPSSMLPMIAAWMCKRAELGQMSL